MLFQPFCDYCYSLCPVAPAPPLKALNLPPFLSSFPFFTVVGTQSWSPSFLGRPFFHEFRLSPLLRFLFISVTPLPNGSLNPFHESFSPHPYVVVFSISWDCYPSHEVFWLSPISPKLASFPDFRDVSFMAGRTSFTWAKPYLLLYFGLLLRTRRHP